MTLRRIAIGFAAFALILGVLAMILRARLKRPPLPPIVVTLPEVPEDNGYDDFLTAVETYVDTGVDLSTEPGVPITAGQRDALTQNQPALAELRGGLRKECVAPPAPAPSQASTDRMSVFRTLTRLLVVESRLASDDGRCRDAVPPLLDGLRFGARLEAGADIIGWHVARAVQSIALRELRRLADSGQLDAADLTKPLQLLAQLEANAPPIPQILEAECRTAAANAASQASSPSARVARLDPASILPALRRERDAAIRLSRKPYAEVKATIESPPRRLTFSPRAVVARMTGETYRRMVPSDFRRRSERRGAQLLLAVELYRLQHGRLPESLTDLESLRIPGVELSIIDPLTEQPYIYRVQDDDYFLYSIGMDLKDDAGAKESFRANKPGDILFHTPPKQ
ncbi:MAG: hypothetical protein PVH68_06170 [Armatimonadota bacterium]|jgi:hypothetical protein